jgi:pyruvate dehydrogenase E2 component (dihydrolipoyllysine-residue acetyltransferase)
MPSAVILPRLGQGMESGTIVRWLKSEGESVDRGEPLYELDTDKVTQEVEAEAAGVLLKIVVTEGEVPVGQTVGFIGEQGEAVPEEQAAAPAEEAATVPAGSQEEPEGAVRNVPEGSAHEEAGTVPAEASTAPAKNGGRMKASPLARRIARERGVDLAALAGTGPEGRIVAEDVERAAVPSAGAAVPAPAPAGLPSHEEVERVELTSVRRTIARRLTEAWQVPVFQLHASADMTRVNELLARLHQRDEDLRVTVTDVLTKACAAALMLHGEVNARYAEDAILRFPSANVAIAVAAPQGLVVPVIHGAERLRLAEIAAARRDLVSRAREGKLRQEDLADGTFTISNLGMFRVERFTAVLNPPQAAIVAVGAIEDRAVPVQGEVAIRPMTTLVATFDHRAVDGAPAAEFLQTVKDFLEEPGLAL